MNLASIGNKFDQFAESLVEELKDEGLELLADGVELVGAALENLVDTLGGAATKFVHDLMGDGGIINGRELSGLEKADLAARQLIDSAATRGIELADHQATYIIKSSYEALAARLRAMKD